MTTVLLSIPLFLIIQVSKSEHSCFLNKLSNVISSKRKNHKCSWKIEIINRKNKLNEIELKHLTSTIIDRLKMAELKPTIRKCTSNEVSIFI
ncbi:hypothetical protein GJ496_005058 [Pomphorhynchus laevis]|nr:hypothetical protein GJ496_005058 [Pomphorhynchus laevis]